MKNIYKIIYAFLIISIVSCNDAIDIEQPGRLGAESAFQSVADLNSGLLGAYNFLDTTAEIGFTAAFTDETFRGRDNGGQNNALQNLNVNTGDGYVFSIWANYYGAINMSNRIIAAATTLIDRDEDPALYDNVLGQAYAIRAFSHFQILAYFSTDYTDSNALAGLLLLEPTSDIFASTARSTNADFYAAIEADLAAAEDLVATDNGPKFIGQDFIKALKARMYAYRGMYDMADDYAEELLASYSISNQTQFFNMWDDADYTEVIFSLERTINDSYDGQGTESGGWAGSLFAFIDPSDSGGPFMEMSRAVFNILDGTPDVRLARYIHPEAQVDPTYETNDNFLNTDVLLVYKYPGSEGQPLMNELKVFRAAEMLMIRAEAAADANDLVGAANFVKQLQDARFGSSQPLPVYANQTEAFGDILDERRIEFWAEGHRYVDLKRLGDRGNRQMERDDRECSFLAGCTLPNTDYRFTLPIPQAEITANDGAEQNPGY